MIPLRVYLHNFLCHIDQEFLFDGHPVWLLHGPNGVGKSAVFDGIVYALFAESNRREGCRTAVADLIRYGEASMRVEFDFEYRGRRYRVWRTRTRRGQPRQGVGEFLNGDRNARPIRQVSSARDLEAWVCDTLGLTYDAFVSAVLLRQGAAERLIDADREARRDLFRGIINLDPYIHLHEAVTTARSVLSGEVRALQTLLERMPEVTDEQIAAASAAHAQAEEAWQQARTAENAARNRLAHARIWETLGETCQTIRRQLDAARGRAARAAELAQTIDRLRRLRVVVPALARVADLRRAAEAAETTLVRLNAERTAAAAGHAQLLAAADQARQQAAAHGSRAAELERLIGSSTAQCDRLRAEIERADQTVGLQRRLEEERLALAGFEPDLDARYAQAEEAAAEAQAARDAYPLLEAVYQHRTTYCQATAHARRGGEIEATATAQVQRLKWEETRAAQSAQTEGGRAEAARQAVAVANNELTWARDRLGRFCTVAGAAVCSECGQPIDAAHAARERSRLEQAVRDTESAIGHCQDESRAAAAAAEAARQTARQLETERRQAEDDRAEAARNRGQAETRADEASSAFDSFHAELSPELAERVGGIDTDGFPIRVDVDRARETGRHLSRRTQARDDLRNRRQDRDSRIAAIATLEEAVRVVGAPADVTAARTELDCVVQSLEELDRARAEAEQEQRNAEQTERKLVEAIRQAASEVTGLAAAEGGAQANATNARARYEEAVRTLPPGALAWDPEALEEELQGFEAANVESEFVAMEEDRTLQAERERHLAQAERQIEEQVPLDARRPSDEVAPEIEVAERAVQLAEQACDAARDESARLAHQRADREATQAQLTAAAHTHALHDRLADLLGPAGIQLDLVRRAEWRIIELANETLGRVSRGELRFEPPDPVGSRAFDLSVRRVGCPEPIPVGNLSGGQRCRVAVSLALAVCRFASGEAQPLQSVIIDEAFANLDRDGRMAMIDVLRDGSVAGDLLRRIIVVSHHEDVAAAFPVGYRLQNIAGATSVIPFG